MQAREPIDSTDLSSASVTYTLKDADGATVDSGSLVYAELSGTFYVFRATIADTVAIVAGASYIAVVAMNGGAGMQAEWSPSVLAETRAA